VPCFGFYEWRKNDNGTKTPFFIHLKDKPFFAMAGIWDCWLDAENKEFKSYAIITTAANETMAPIHTRMPVILSKDDEAVWLNKRTSADMLQDLLIPYRSESIEAYEISPDINNPKNNSLSLLKKTQ
jgi:putative SOS response-associated peptidase YedK